MKFHLKKRIIIFESLFSPSFDVLYSSPIVYMDHTEPVFHDLLFYCTQKVTIIFFHFFHGGETHFLVLAQALIYISFSLSLNSGVQTCDIVSILLIFCHGMQNIYSYFHVLCLLCQYPPYFIMEYLYFLITLEPLI